MGPGLGFEMGEGKFSEFFKTRFFMAGQREGNGENFDVYWNSCLQ